MTRSQRAERVHTAARLLADHYGLADAEQHVKERYRDAEDPEFRGACLEALSWLRRQRHEASPELVADGGWPSTGNTKTSLESVDHYSWRQVYRELGVRGAGHE